MARIKDLADITFIKNSEVALNSTFVFYVYKKRTTWLANKIRKDTANFHGDISISIKKYWYFLVFL